MAVLTSFSVCNQCQTCAIDGLSDIIFIMGRIHFDSAIIELMQGLNLGLNSGLFMNLKNVFLGLS